MSNHPTLNQLCAAAMRAIAANGCSRVGKDGRTRVDLESVIAQGNLANMLRAMFGEIPQHEVDCAARGAMPAECNCSVREVVEAIESGK